MTTTSTTTTTTMTTTTTTTTQQAEIEKVVEETARVVNQINDEYQRVEDYVKEKEVVNKVENFAKNIFGRK
jgi:hypothetical protein